MLDRENTGLALGSRAEDTDFWMLVCEDEEWLRAEFGAIVSEPTETPVRRNERSSGVTAQPPGRDRLTTKDGHLRVGPVCDRHGCRCVRERSPPVRTLTRQLVRL